MDKEVGYGAEEDDGGGDGTGEKHLHAQYNVYFPDECPTELRGLKHHGVKLVIVGVVVVVCPGRLNVTFVATAHVWNHKLGF